MSTRKPSSRTRAYRPATDDLESRQLLSGVVSGTDIDGDIWTLRLNGPGSISVVKQADASGQPQALSSASEIGSITIGGTDPLRTRITGTVTKSASGDGKVFFQNMTALPARSERFTGVGFGILSIDMPGFWLGNTTPAGSTSSPTAPEILIPDGVDTFKFGGVDTTHNPVPTTSSSTSDTTFVELGLPMFGGTRLIIDKSISSTQQAPPASGSTTPQTIQHQVTFAVSGRLQLFQANEIVGDAAHPPGQFGNQNSAATGIGGTTVASVIGGESGFFLPTASTVIKGGVGGAMGFVRVGGNATNFTTIVHDQTGGGTDRISNFYVGGETNNVMLIAPNGARDVAFGKGMDNVEIRTHVINSLKANRGANNSTVAVDRQLGLADFGGDVTNTTVIAGAIQNYQSMINTVTGQSSSIFASASPAPPPLPLNAQPSGSITAHVAGDVTNSVFAASVEPFNGVYGDPNELILPTGVINAKVEGTINNATATPSSPGQAFYAQSVKVNRSPVAPAGVAEQPYAHASNYPFLPGLHGQKVRVGRVTPAGPVAARRTK